MVGLARPEIYLVPSLYEGVEPYSETFGSEYGSRSGDPLGIIFFLLYPAFRTW